MLFLKYLQFYLILDNHFLVSLNLEIVVLNLLIVLIVDFASDRVVIVVSFDLNLFLNHHILVVDLR